MSFRKKEIKTKNGGITLIALVITIIVLLILAGVTIATLMGDNGILTKASEASEKSKQANAEEQVRLSVVASIGEDGNINIDALNDELEKIGAYYNENPISSINKIESLPADVIVDGYTITINANGSTENDNSGGDAETGETIVDGITIPEGFYYVGGTKISGLVISDNEDDENRYENQELVGTDLQGNQYVWIPVDGVLGEDGTISDVTGSEKKILLGRYNFDSSGIPSEYSGAHKEENSRDTENLLNYGNTIANDIEAFIDSVRDNEGYYIARFEASRGTNNKAESKYNKSVWTYISQPNAAIACRNLYTGVNSDLMNSYAWDTAILFIQKYGQNNYSRQNGTLINSSKQTTGLSGDLQLNIYDMSGNCYEWTTETALLDNITPGVTRGCSYDDTYFYTSIRIMSTISSSGSGRFFPFGFILVML